ncbi:gliding motility-associated C-terminal domain-containing protein [Spirosoma flavum]|uniref:Gliding motility-associated C-terminal domain-containing protein n=1 Tax=Spirosoma flavum TaxID=2048557 RepID=A0ABW6ADK9_9BACT
MRRQLLAKFIGNFRWLVVLSLLTSRVIASTYPLADTCQNSAPPVIAGSANAVCRNEPVTLTAKGCIGTVVWSNGETGGVIQVQPQQTTKYTAICRARPGCISCFADVWKVVVNTPGAPVVTSSAKVVCANDAVTLTASNCTGVIHWSDQTTGAIWTGKLQQTTTFQATCKQNNCLSNPSALVSVQVATPITPIISASKTEICAGQPIQLTASGCVGTIRWADGSEGLVKTVIPYQTTKYRAICQIGSCRSDSSESVSIVVRTADQPLTLLATLSNGCPFQTADLSKAITEKNSTLSPYYQFRTGPLLTASIVQSPGAVLAGKYYIFGCSKQGCYTDPVAVTVRITPCQNAVSPCMSNPATVAVQLDSLDWVKGVVRLTAQLGGSANETNWQSDGGGLFTDTGLTARYLLSETDRQRGTALFTLSIPDPDGNGPCVGASVQRTITAPSREMVGLSKKVNEPVWLTERDTHLVELTYQLTLVNLGAHALTDMQITDNLDAAFSSSSAQIHSVNSRADSGLVTKSTYTGRGADTTLLSSGNLAAGKQGRIWLTVRLDMSQATTLTFVNKAIAEGVDINGTICRDRSTNGIEADPDQNGNPGDNEEPTTITLHSLRPEEGETVFIPEGFSPNGDGINDLFVIRRLPVNLTAQLDVYNRWGHVVYHNTDYKNDWNGKANQGANVADAKEGLPDGTYYYQIRLSDSREYVRFLTLAR